MTVWGLISNLMLSVYEEIYKGVTIKHIYDVSLTSRQCDDTCVDNTDTNAECKDHKEFPEQVDQYDGLGTTVEHMNGHAREVL